MKAQVRNIGCYRTTEEIEEAMEICLESIDIIRNLVRGMELDSFANDRAVVDRCAINFQIIGNQVGRLDPCLLFNQAMSTAYS